MAEYRNLLLAGAKLVGVDDELALLDSLAAAAKALVKMVEAWDALKDKVAGASSAAELLDQIAKDLNTAQIVQAFKDVGLGAEYSRIADFVRRIDAAADAVPDKYKWLLDPLSAFTAGKAGVVDWKGEAAAKPAAGPQYALDLSAQGSFGFEAAAAWPDTGAGLPATLLKLGAHGEVGAKANATAPYAFGGAKAKADATAKVDLGYYFEAPRDELYAAAVARRLDDLPDPFDYDSALAAFTRPGSDLDGVAFQLGGSADLSVEIAVADSLTLESGVTVGAKATLAVSVGLKNSYDLKLTRLADRSGFRATLGRKAVDEAAFATSFALGVDVSAALAPVVKALKQAVDTWETALEPIKPYLSPGTWLRDKAGAALGQLLGKLIDDDPLLKAAVEVDLKTALGLGGDGTSLEAWATGRVMAAFDRGSVVVTGTADQAADQVLAVLAERLPMLNQGDAKAQLQAVLKAQVDQLRGEFETAVKALFAKDAQALAKALKNAGAEADQAVQGADKALAAVRDLIGRYDKLLHDLLKGVEDAAKQKITAEFYDRETRTDTDTVELTADFRPAADNTGASRAYQALTRGRWDDLFELIESPATPPGITLDRAASSMTRTAELTRETGFKVVFLKFSVEAKELLTSKVTIKVDGMGRVRVMADGKLDKDLVTPMNSRKASFTDSYALALAGATRDETTRPALELGVAASFSDDNLTWGEIQDFAKRLEAAKLLAPDAVARAKTAFDRMAAGKPGIDGDVGATLSLSGQAVDRLLRLPGPAQLDPAARTAIMDLGMAWLGRTGALRQADFAGGGQVAISAVLSTPKPQTVTEMMHTYPDRLRDFLKSGTKNRTAFPKDEDPPAHVPGLGGGSLAFRHYVYFLEESFRLHGLVKMIETMRAIDLATPSLKDHAPGTWTRGQYGEAQETLLRESGFWLQRVDSLGSLFEAEIARRTVGFMGAMAELAGVWPDHGGATLTLTHRPKTGAPETVAFGWT